MREDDLLHPVDTVLAKLWDDESLSSIVSGAFRTGVNQDRGVSRLNYRAIALSNGQKNGSSDRWTRPKPPCQQQEAYDRRR
jgi:hypothetical protein